MSDDNAVALKVRGVPITTGQRDRAWARWLALPIKERKNQALERLLESEGVDRSTTWSAGARLIQAGKKRGEIFPVRPGACWCLADERALRDQSCTYCRFYSPSLNLPFGKCRRHAPQFTSDDVSDWPKVFENDWCGQWEARDDTQG